MIETHPRARYVIGPDGGALTIADLPAVNTKRWVPRRKAEVVAAVRGGLISLEEACSRYSLTGEEFLATLQEQLVEACQRRSGVALPAWRSLSARAAPTGHHASQPSLPLPRELPTVFEPTG
jgi:hypothetical protein